VGEPSKPTGIIVHIKMLCAIEFNSDSVSTRSVFLSSHFSFQSFLFRLPHDRLAIAAASGLTKCGTTFSAASVAATWHNS
jgi:hypothetical protein